MGSVADWKGQLSKSCRFSPPSCIMGQFVEEGPVYRVSWAMEAIRVHAFANGDPVSHFG